MHVDFPRSLRLCRGVKAPKFKKYLIFTEQDLTKITFYIIYRTIGRIKKAKFMSGECAFAVFISSSFYQQSILD